VKVIGPAPRRTSPIRQNLNVAVPAPICIFTGGFFGPAAGAAACISTESFEDTP
jgi:hypothetical protein